MNAGGKKTSLATQVLNRKIQCTGSTSNSLQTDIRRHLHVMVQSGLAHSVQFRLHPEVDKRELKITACF